MGTGDASDAVTLLLEERVMSVVRIGCTHGVCALVWSVLFVACTSDPEPTVSSTQPPALLPSLPATLVPVAQSGNPGAAAKPSVTSAQWTDDISRRIAIGEYRLNKTRAGLSAWNRANRIRSHFGADGVDLDVVRDHGLNVDTDRALIPADVTSTTPTAPAPAPTNVAAAHAPDAEAGHLRIQAVGIARGDRRAATGPVVFAPGRCRSDGAVDELGDCLRRAEASTAHYQEWWENKAEGLEQGFDFLSRPLEQDGDAPLRIELEVTGAEVTLAEDGQSAVLINHLDQRVTYGQLHAFDADDRTLLMRLVPHEGGLAIEVDDRGARYPITVDPLVSANWAQDSNQTSAAFGSSVASAGDVNGDGYGDVIVGAPLYDTSTLSDAGRVYLYLGSATGLGVSAAWLKDGDRASAQFGAAVAGAGDVNGDGIGDVIIGAANYSNGQSLEGAVFVFHGRTTGAPLDANANWMKESNLASASYGYSVTSAGDVNGDGIGDVAIGAPTVSDGQTWEGRVDVHYGINGTGLASAPQRTLYMNQAGAAFGVAVASAGDVNGDGFSDLLVGAHRFSNPETNEGNVFLFRGGSAGLETSAWWTGQGNQADAFYGTSVAGIGDVNGDGYSDVLIGAPSYDSGEVDEGAAFLYLGGASALTTFGTVFQSNQAGAMFGTSVASAGDINADGYADAIVGGLYFDAPLADAGRSWVYAGSSPAFLSLLTTLDGDQNSGHFGSRVASAGDVNGDGRSDVIIGARSYDFGHTDEGRAYLYKGSELTATSLSPVWTSESNQANARCIDAASAGDVNGDGFDDFLVTYAEYDSDLQDEGRALLFLGSASGLGTSAAWTTESGQANAYLMRAASAGDVNGDGYDDVFVGSSGYDEGQFVDRGRAQVFLGSASGLALTAAWTFLGSTNGAGVGYSGGSAGDVNGDGYSDVLVGAPLFSDANTSAEGKAFLFLGSATGLSTTATWTKEGNQANASFGLSLGSAGDVNGDGRGDVIIGAPYYTNNEVQEGRAWLYLGTASGLQTNAARTIEVNVAHAALGASVAGSGDVNGDGLDDVIVGAPLYEEGEIGEGAVFVYLGDTGTGLELAPFMAIQWNVASAGFGTSVAAAGDVNADGYADVVVGAPGYAPAGLALAMYGGPTTLNLGIMAMVHVGAQPNVGHAYRVGAAGDVNGDGYTDLFLTSHAYSNGQANEGATFVHLGAGLDGAAGMALRPQARRPNLTTPIRPGGKSMSSSGFDATLRTARGPMGRSRAKLRVEAKPLGTAFNGTTGLSTSAWTTTALAGTSIKRLVDTTLAGGTTPHWRARLIYDPSRFPWFQQSRWIYGGKHGQPGGVHVRIAP